MAGSRSQGLGCLGSALAATLGGGCEPPGSPARGAAAALEELRTFEDELLAARGPQSAWSNHAGPDPTAVAPVGEGRFIGLLRGDGAVVLLDAEGHELHRVPAVGGASGWDVLGREVVTVGERSTELAWFVVEGERLVETRRQRVEGVHGLRDVAFGPAGRVYVADRHRGRILAVPLDGGGTQTLASCPGALEVDVRGSYLLASCLLSHEVLVLGLDARGNRRPGEPARIEHHGPIWAIDARVDGLGITLAAAGVEDRPLDRSGSGFGSIDSFVFVYTISLDLDAVRRDHAVNVSAMGVVTPKWVEWRGDELLVTGAGSDVAARLSVSTSHVTSQTRSVPAGLTVVAGSERRGLAANPLLDRWVVLGPESWRAVEVEGSRAGWASGSSSARVGEALAMTTLIAPRGRSDGRASRFTCETCHFEGTVDGRVHATGRPDVYATTKTIRGVVGNRPHFSRALDATTADMVHNEFRVANDGTAQDPWFDLWVEDIPWLAVLTEETEITAIALRRSLLEFLDLFGPELNPAVLGLRQFNSLQRKGAAVFDDYCASCHAPRLQADAPETAVPRSRWEAHILGEGGLVWASAQRARVGVTPLVHPEGPRVPSLRRLWAKRPYFTNGSAADLPTVLQRVRVEPRFSHAGGQGQPMPRSEREALLAFLDLL